MGSSVIIQKERGEFVNANGFNAWQGLDKRGYEARSFGWEEMASDEVPVGPGTITVGSVLFLRRALGRIGLESAPLDDPARLAGHLPQDLADDLVGGPLAARCPRSDGPCE